MNRNHDDLYDRKAAEYNWRGPEIIFGLAYPYINQGESILDMGIGTGLGSEPFAGAGLKVYGMDISEKMLDICRDKGFTWGLQKHDLRNIPYPYEYNAFHHALALSVFLIFEEIADIFKETGRIIRPGGIFGFTAEDIKPGQAVKYQLDPEDQSKEPDPDTAITVYRHSFDYIKDTLEKTGFELLKWIEFLAYQSPKRDKDIYYTAYLARKL
ncbi:MAG: methyltransferase domain-containing protein [candidate division Zixibacteria bacterium]|nr:methyltransferase domain-containing protein [candidate division Zixibacteria bacterium]